MLQTSSCPLWRINKNAFFRQSRNLFRKGTTTFLQACKFGFIFKRTFAQLPSVSWAQSGISPSLTAAFYRKYLQTDFMKRRSLYNNFTDRETEAHVLATVNLQTPSHRGFFLSESSLCGKYEQPLLPEGFYMLLLSSLSSAARTYTLCGILAQTKDPRPQFQKVRHCSPQLLKQTLADLFSSAGVFFSSSVLAALLSSHLF